MSDDTPKQPEAAQRGAGDYLVMTTASSIKTRRKRFLWDGLIPLGTCSLMSGKGGEGKSTMSLHVAAQVTRGGLDGDLHGQPRDVLIVSPEDEADTITVNRLKAAGADLDRVHFVSIGAEFDGADGTRHIRLPTDTRFIRQGILQSGAALVILDPVTALVDGSNDKVQDVRAAVGPVDQIAQDLDVSIVLVSHFNKGAGSVSNKVTGSHAWRDVVRSLLVFAYDSENDVRVMSQDKSNYSTENESLEFALVSTPVPTDDGEIANVGRVQIIGTTSTSVEQIINRSIDPEDFDGDESSQWLLRYLDREPFEFPRKEVMSAARGEGYSERTIGRAREKIGATTITTSTFPARTMWRHPSYPSDDSGTAGTTEPTAPVRGTAGTTGITVPTSTNAPPVEPVPHSRASHASRATHGMTDVVEPVGGTQDGDGGGVLIPDTFATYAPPSPVPSGSEPPTEDVCADCGNPLPPQHIFTGCPRCAAEGRTA
ncbi:AAA domain-containing protein [Brevibacterium sp. Mu109]|uniref:AAA family ATPase n=1 Tax=Brevibacterium sp. Mu109 TaxID=1255669 RepID=UPI000C580516|nr:AAA family ATPase [Brevibacterium sp. Mu109]SMX80687.1 AAA domain-containing protein [Brevibacterium sp. Mu109]